MKIEERVSKLTNDLYNAYGSGTGVLFGIPTQLRSSVRVIIKSVIEVERKQFCDAIDDSSCHEAPNVCQCCQELDELKKEFDY